MNTLFRNIGEGVLRHIVTYAAGLIVSSGYISGNEATQVVGAVMVLFTIGWSAIDKARTETRVAVALATPVPEPIILSPNDPRDNTADLNRDEVKRVKG